MNILILGGAGMVGRKLVERLAKDGTLGGKPITGVTLHDVVEATAPTARFPVRVKVGDVSSATEIDDLLAAKPDVVFHLAAIVSGEAEANFELGYRVNLSGSWNLFDALRVKKLTPRVVFTSSIAVFGAPFPEAIPDDFHLTPLTSYGTQKAIGELLLADYTRKGYFDGVGLRFPTIREPLAGHEAVLPVGEAVRHWHASPRAAVGFLLHAATMDTAMIGPRRNLTMPGLAATVGEQIAALRAVAGDAVAARIRRVPDETIMKIVAGWPRNFDARRARDLGFEAETSFEDIIKAHVDDELGGKIAA